MAAAAQRMVQKGIQLRGVHGPALRAIQDGESPVVAVIPTGGGKSMLFMLPAWVEPGGTTVVVIPLLALRQDFQRRCQQLGISCVAWESRRPPDETSIVLVTPESAVTPDFHSFLNRLRLIQRLDRIIIDEYHIMLQEGTDFRPAMQRLGRLVAAHTQLVLLTATLPPRLEDRLFQCIQHAREDISMFQNTPTTRTNIQYRVWRPEVGHISRGPHAWLQMEAVEAFICEQIATATGQGGKVIIYANIISQVTAVAKQYSCKAYYSQGIDRPGVLQRFMDGISPVIAATSALDYAQESGRAGRDGQISRAIIIQPEGWDKPAAWMQEVPPADQQLVQQYLTAPCRRQVLDAYLDGVQRVGCAPGKAACDQCQPAKQQDKQQEPLASRPVARPGGVQGRQDQHKQQDEQADPPVAIPVGRKDGQVQQQNEPPVGPQSRQQDQQEHPPAGQVVGRQVERQVEQQI
ncbi:hypothetical protein FE257_004863 [Aspergillus nanangensis]|uniref:Helicase ATP-binding domain-containing protein n=1 Tax=Aspergillus nanangensis TaxID=2582783 RepID=A0AAD4CAZ3_ASPNN|nr:hypothetical protein FE257_004863 [Aspergillus nanangensis]